MRLQKYSRSSVPAAGKRAWRSRARVPRLVCRAESTPSEEATKEQAIECVGEGQSVTCSIEEVDSPGPPDPNSAAPAVLDGPGGVSELLSLALLVSPFFFWGTSMVFMKVCFDVFFPLPG